MQSPGRLQKREQSSNDWAQRGANVLMRSELRITNLSFKKEIWENSNSRESLSSFTAKLGIEQTCYDNIVACYIDKLAAIKHIKGIRFQ